MTIAVTFLRSRGLPRSRGTAACDIINTVTAIRAVAATRADIRFPAIFDPFVNKLATFQPERRVNGTVYFDQLHLAAVRNDGHNAASYAVRPSWSNLSCLPHQRHDR